MAAIIFDLDGTLVESAAAIRDVANSLMGELSLEPLTLDETRAFVGRGTPVFLERALRSRDAFDEANFPGHLARLQQFYGAAPGGANTQFPGVDAQLKALVADGHRLGLCTNKPLSPTQAVIAAHNWSDMFKSVIAGDSLPWRKPDPRPLQIAAERTSWDRAVFVGDSEIDAATALAAGIPFVFFTGGYCHVDHREVQRAATFSDFSELPDAIATALG